MTNKIFQTFKIFTTMSRKKNFLFYSLFLMSVVMLLTTYSCEKDKDSAITVTDADGNVYQTVEIGSQVWMTTNLKTTKYNDGSDIPLISDTLVWSGLVTPGYTWYKNDESNKPNYGALYNWHTVNTGNLAPAGWHVATHADWTTLQNYLIDNGYNYEDGVTGNHIAKALASTSGWTPSANIGAVGNTDFPEKRNKSNFNAMPGGHINNTSFKYAGSYGYWWTSTAYNDTAAWSRVVYFSDTKVDFPINNKNKGFSVRCVRD